MKKTKQSKLDNFGMRMYKPKVMTQEDMQDGIRKAVQSSKPKKSIFDLKTTDKFLKKQPEKKEEPEEEPYWTAGQWEEWAIQLYRDYPKAREYLPSWIIEAVE